MGFGEVGGGPLRGVVGVGVVEAYDVEREGAGLALDFYELLRSYVVAVVRGVGAGVAGADDLVDVIAFGVGFAEQEVRAGREAVIVTILPDSSEKYMSDRFWQEQD